jgi:hypothetical protein
MYSLENKLKKKNNKDSKDNKDNRNNKYNKDNKYNKNEKQKIYPRYCPICGGYRKGCILYQQELVRLKNKRTE